MKMRVFACLMALLMIASSAYAWEAPYNFRRVVRRVRHAQKAERLIAARAEHIKSTVLIEQRCKDRQSGIIDLLYARGDPAMLVQVPANAVV